MNIALARPFASVSQQRQPEGMSPQFGASDTADRAKQAAEKTTVFASADTFMDGEAIAQLKKTAELPGILQAVGFPDLHYGKGIPIGAAFATDDILYPHLIGNDIGCRMAFSQSDLKKGKFKLAKVEKKLEGLESPWDGALAQWLESRKIDSTRADSAMGTIGGGNHFAELQQVEKIMDPKAFAKLGLEPDRIFSLIHSGSRGFGDAVFQRHVGDSAQNGLAVDSEAGKAYLKDHDLAVKWAGANVELIGQRLFEQLGAESRVVSDNVHNSIEKVTTPDGTRQYIHRKGAGAANQGPFMIAGSRGALSYLVEPIGDGQKNLYSLAHGAGRKWKRGVGKAKLGERESAESLTRTALGSRVICEDKTLIFDEAPPAYKKIEQVIEDLRAAALLKVIATFRPLLTYKKRNTNTSEE